MRMEEAGAQPKRRRHTGRKSDHDQRRPQRHTWMMYLFRRTGLIDLRVQPLVAHRTRNCQATISDRALGPRAGSSLLNNPTFFGILSLLHHRPQLANCVNCAPMASIAAACRLSARVATQQLRNHGTRRGRSCTARGMRNGLTVACSIPRWSGLARCTEF